MVSGLAKAGQHPGGAAGLGPAGPGGEAGDCSEGDHQEGETAGRRSRARRLLQGAKRDEPGAEHPALPGLAAGRDGPLPAHLGKSKIRWGF